MKRMRRITTALRKWLPQAPRWSALLLGLLIAADAGHLLSQVRTETRLAADRGAARPAASTLGTPDPQRIAAAHLFGLEPAAAHARTERAAETQLPLALNGVIATSDPNEGYAILGEPGHATRLYRTGAALTNEGDGSGALYQVFADRVVLDFGGRLETVRLPRQALKLLAGTPRHVGPMLSAIEDPADDPPSLAQAWFSNLNTERYPVPGGTAVRMHPTTYMERRYGLHDGDTVNAVNGVPTIDEDAVDGTLHAGGQTVALTLTHDGVQETKTFSVDD